MSLFGPSEKQLKLQEEARARAKQAELDYGPLPEEGGIEEGDLSDYVAPFKGIGKALLKGGMKGAFTLGAKEAADQGKKKGVKALFSKMPQKTEKKDTRPSPPQTSKWDEEKKAFIDTPPPPKKQSMDDYYKNVRKIQQKPEATEKLVYDKFGNPTKVKN